MWGSILPSTRSAPSTSSRSTRNSQEVGDYQELPPPTRKKKTIAQKAREPLEERTLERRTSWERVVNEDRVANALKEALNQDLEEESIIDLNRPRSPTLEHIKEEEDVRALLSSSILTYRSEPYRVDSPPTPQSIPSPRTPESHGQDPEPLENLGLLLEPISRGDPIAVDPLPFYEELPDVSTVKIRVKAPKVKAVKKRKPQVVAMPKMIAPNHRDAPKFNPEKPEELLRFLRAIEAEFTNASFNGDKTEEVRKYTDARTEEEWRALDNYGDPTKWAEFKEELINSYLEATSLRTGSYKKLQQVCKENRRIRIKDLGPFLSYKRSFLAEAKKLQEPPVLIANATLVQMFMSSLTEEFQMAVYQKLDFMKNQDSHIKAMIDKFQIAHTLPAAANIPRRAEDRYTLSEVVRAAEDTARTMMPGVEIGAMGVKSEVPEASVSRAPSVKIEQTEVTLLNGEVANMRNEFAQLRDKLSIQDKVSAKLLDQLTSMNQLMNAAPSRAATAQVLPVTTMPRMSPEKNMNCIFCNYPGHFISECKFKQTYLESGKVLLGPDGRLQYVDGKPIIPDGTGRCMRERIDSYRPQAVNYYSYGYEQEMGVYNYQMQEDSAMQRDLAQLQASLTVNPRNMPVPQKAYPPVDMVPAPVPPQNSGNDELILLMCQLLATKDNLEEVLAQAKTGKDKAGF